MRQPNGIMCTELVQGDQVNRQKTSGEWVPARDYPHNAFGWKWRFKMAWAVLIGEADALFWDESE